jgi:hypothetical protein
MELISKTEKLYTSILKKSKCGKFHAKMIKDSWISQSPIKYTKKIATQKNHLENQDVFN